VKRVLALIYGVAAYVFFLGTFGYAIGFVGNVGVPKSIDTATATSLGMAIAINALLLAGFAIQHSVMARQSFKRLWTRIVPKCIERSTYVFAASLALAQLVWQWRAIPDTVWDVQGSLAGTVLTVSFWTGWAVLLVSTYLVNHFELFGLEQVWTYFRGSGPQPASFKSPGFYRVVRHPIYAGFVIAFWSAPVMTVGHLIFSIATTGYILVGIAFEERDLITFYGQTYREYRQHVPMLVPFLKRGKAPVELEVAEVLEESVS
jgi:protein-S-isoprenylcysteine O-methyltransferase Ste14